MADRVLLLEYKFLLGFGGVEQRFWRNMVQVLMIVHLGSLVHKLNPKP